MSKAIGPSEAQASQAMSRAEYERLAQFGPQEFQAMAERGVIKRMRDQGMSEEAAKDATYKEFIGSGQTAPVSELPRSLVNAVIHQESRGNANAVSPKGAQGLMQIMPATAKEIAAELGVTDYDLKDRETNQRFGEYYLAKQLKRFGTPELALAAYNAGPGKVQMWINKYGPSWDAISKGIADDIAARRLNREYYRETLNYVPSIMKRVVSV